MKPFTLFALFSLLAVSLSANAGTGSRFEKLETPNHVYYRVKVTKVSPASITILHGKGISQIMMEDLSEDLREQFGFDAASAHAYKTELEARNEAAKAAREREREERRRNKITAEDPVEKILNHFGTPPELKGKVDLRPEFRKLELITKNQGRRPSCSVFAVVSALEYQNALLSGKAEKLSEEYLIWATRKTLGQAQTGDAKGNYRIEEDDLTGDADAGFSLLEVVQALRGYGIPLAEEMPNTYGKSMAGIQAPSEKLIETAQRRRRVFAYLITGRDGSTKIDGIIRVLNEGFPVVIGIRWPHYKTLRNAPILGSQKPREGYGHAVTLVGYKCETGRYEDVLFTFKNSYGRRWGINGYGYATYPYLRKNLEHAVFLDVKKGKSS